jgi:hypothetical protein
MSRNRFFGVVSHLYWRFCVGRPEGRNTGFLGIPFVLAQAGPREDLRMHHALGVMPLAEGPTLRLLAAHPSRVQVHRGGVLGIA